MTASAESAPSAPLESLRHALTEARAELVRHPVYHAVDSPEKLRLFMGWHVFAVWDFMSLAKRLQRDVTCVTLPWTPPASAAAARFVNEVVLSEESDVGPDGNPASHLELYVRAMEEVEADTAPIETFLRQIESGTELSDALVAARAPEGAAAFVGDTIDIAQNGTTVEVAAAFLFGREDVIPDMFERLLEHWSEDSVAWFRYYLQRHIELDGDEHGPLAERLLADVAGTDPVAWKAAEEAATRAIRSRLRLWDDLVVALESVSGLGAD